MEPRLNLFAGPVVAKALKYFASASRVLIKESSLPKPTQDLVMPRASQINGCGYCTDAHSKDLAHAGESATRINLVAAWRETGVFTDAERAAPELTEQGTRISDGAGGITDEARTEAARHYDEEQLSALVCFISLINSSNRFGVVNRTPGGDYRPGDFD
ncbi:alkylhydroperoxidase [Streptomyces populi]|uniref:Alkylhydroperoxidase n=1 Tax=Streptomyces populi TaxID=2058924 RepID=A0A2I0SBW1_9ACTN|nr:carboxymuconolactone decarboxylase family protein [Streptomyces populi]PKT67389.1 alkylhydroperoxidase [Streptomyces populi]